MVSGGLGLTEGVGEGEGIGEADGVAAKAISAGVAPGSTLSMSTGGGFCSATRGVIGTPSSEIG